jgi:hypothetical protein
MMHEAFPTFGLKGKTVFSFLSNQVGERIIPEVMETPNHAFFSLSFPDIGIGENVGGNLKQSYCFRFLSTDDLFHAAECRR